jgi:hypothetical protein
MNLWHGKVGFVAVATPQRPLARCGWRRRVGGGGSGYGITPYGS